MFYAPFSLAKGRDYLEKLFLKIPVYDRQNMSDFIPV